MYADLFCEFSAAYYEVSCGLCPVLESGHSDSRAHVEETSSDVKFSRLGELKYGRSGPKQVGGFYEF